MVAWPRQSRLILTLALSLALHNSFWFLPLARDRRERPVTIVEFNESRPTPAAKAVRTRLARPESLPARGESKALPPAVARARPLVLGTSHWSSFSPAPPPSGEVTAGSRADQPEARWGAGGGDFSRTKDYLMVRRVQEQVQGLLSYPAALIERQVGGYVNARVVVDAKGRCDWQKTSISGERAELRVYVLSLLKKFCGLGFWHGMPIDRAASNLDLSFNFDLFAKEEKPPRVLGNVVLFDIPGKEFHGNWRLGPLKGNLFIPNFVFLNEQWIVENWERLVLKKDPFEEFREKESGFP